MKHLLSLALVLVAGLLFASRSQARVLRVPSTIPTIPAAIDSAAAGDTILVAPGTYYVNLDTGGKYLIFLSEAGAEQTILDGEHLDSVVKLTGSGVIDGFTIRNGQAEDHGGGVYVGDPFGASLPDGTIRNSVIEHCTAGYYDSGGGGGIYVWVRGGTFTIDRCLIQDNYGGYTGGGIDAWSTVIVTGCTLLRNGCHVCGGGAGGVEVIEGCIIADNWSDHGGAGLCDCAQVRHNTIVGNHTGNGVTPMGAGIDLGSSSAVVSNNLVAFNYGPAGSHTAVGIYSMVGGTFDCNDSYGNDGDDYSWDISGSSNLSRDPLLCNFGNSDYHLRSDSPCTADSTGCGLIGALGVGCSPTPIQPMSWGKLKIRYGVDDENASNRK